MPKLTVTATIEAPLEKVWDRWTNPEHIIRWNAASDDWHTTKAENDLREGGSFNARMEAKNGSMGFDFAGVYTAVKPHELIEYKLGDARQVKIEFAGNENTTTITETFDAENENSLELQQKGWQMILDNFKRYTES